MIKTYQLLTKCALFGAKHSHFRPDVRLFFKQKLGRMLWAHCYRHNSTDPCSYQQAFTFFFFYFVCKPPISSQSMYSNSVKAEISIFLYHVLWYESDCTLLSPSGVLLLFKIFTFKTAEQQFTTLEATVKVFFPCF